MEQASKVVQTGAGGSAEVTADGVTLQSAERAPGTEAADRQARPGGFMAGNTVQAAANSASSAIRSAGAAELVAAGAASSPKRLRLLVAEEPAVVGSVRGYAGSAGGLLRPAPNVNVADFKNPAVRLGDYGNLEGLVVECSWYHDHMPEDGAYVRQFLTLLDDTGDVALKNFHCAPATQAIIELGEAYRWTNVRREPAYKATNLMEGTWGERGTDNRRAGTVCKVVAMPGWCMPQIQPVMFAQAHRLGGDELNKVFRFSAKVRAVEVKSEQKDKYYRRQIVFRDDELGEETVTVWCDYAKEGSMPFQEGKAYFLLGIERSRSKSEKNQRVYTNFNLRASGTIVSEDLVALRK